jgi:CO/xanthine dehydrogenase FAD-binding subunit
MILEYYRPQTQAEALELLTRPDLDIRPLAGGTILNHPADDDFAVVDLQALDWNTVDYRNNQLTIGATVTLQALVDWVDHSTAISQSLAETLSKVLRLETTLNLRRMASVAGTAVTARGHSPFLACLLALDATMFFLPEGQEIGLGNWLPLRSEKPLSPITRRIIRSLTLPVNSRLAYHFVARAPTDRPLVSAAVAVWPSGRIRAVLGGFGESPTLALDGMESVSGSPDGTVQAARSAYLYAEDEWASAEYRSEMAAVLTRRCLDDLYP